MARNQTVVQDSSGNASVTNNFTAASLIRSGGTAAQILAANGSVITAGTGITISGGVISSSASSGVSSFNTRTGAVTLTSSDVTTALGYTPLSSYTETDTLATVTGRGASTSTSLTLNGGIIVGAGVATGRSSWGSFTNANIILASSTSDSTGNCGIEFRSGNNFPSDGAAIFFENNAGGGSERAKLTIRVENDQEDFIELRGGNITLNGNTISGGGQNPVVVFQSGGSTVSSISSSGVYNGNITGTAASETLATVTGRGASTTSNISFGSQTRQMISLWGTQYGIGVQSSTTYFRSDSRFSWHRGGTHNDNENNPGGGTVAMTLDGSSNLAVAGSITSGGIAVVTNNGGTWGINVTGLAAAETLSTVTNRGNTTGTSIYIDQGSEGFVFRTSTSWGGWARNTHVISTSANSVLAAFGGFGSGTSLSYSYIGTDYLNTWIRFSSSAVNSQVALQQGGNQVWHAGNFTPGNYLPLSGGTMTGVLTLKVSGAWSTYDSALSVRGDASNPAIITFHRPGYFATNLGLDTDGVIKIGGWSNGGPWPILHSNNYSSYALPLSGGTMSGAIIMSGTQQIRQAGFSGIEYYNSGSQWQGYIGTENNTGNLRYNSFNGSHTWYANSSQTMSLNSSGALNLTGAIQQNSNRWVRDSVLRTISGQSDNYSGGTSGWYEVATITLTGNCSGAVLYGTLYDNRFDGADAYQISVVARAECDFTSNNESHYINVGCTILGSTNYTNYRDKIRVVLVASSAGSRTYELQFFETPWNNDTWQLETTGWTIFSSPQAPGSAVGTPRVNYISNKNADNIRANTTMTVGGNTVWHQGNLTNLNQLTNGPGYITSSGSISGNAATATTASNSNAVNGISVTQIFNNMGNVHGTRTSFDATTPSYDFGFRYVQGSGNGPGTGGGQFYSWYIGLGNDYPATGGGSYGAMFAVDRNTSNPYLSVRYNENNSFGSWRRISAGYADSAGSLSSMNISQFTNNSGYITQSTGDGRYLMGTTNPGSVNNFTISIGNNGSYSYVQSHLSQPLELNPVGNTVRIAGNVAIHAGNYNSYSPTLTGGGASGTWGINITGNSATVSSITNITGLMTNRLTPTSFIDSLTTSTFRSYVFGTNTNGAALSAARWNNIPPALSGMNMYGTLIGWSGDSDTHGFIATDYNVANAQIGGGFGNNISWRATLLHSGNYNSYSPTLTGGNASGTWSINITGNSGYASSAGNADTVDGWHRDDLRAWGNHTGIPGNITYWNQWYGSSYLGSNGDLYLSWYGWLSNAINQDVRSSASPSFSGLYVLSTFQTNTGSTSYFGSTYKYIWQGWGWGEWMYIYGGVGGGTRMYLDTLYATYGSISDMRYKINVNPLHYGLEQISQLNPISYVYNYPPNHISAGDKSTHLGLSAQEVQSIMPELVHNMVDKDMLAITMVEMIPVLVNAIKQQQVQIEDLKNQINLLVDSSK